MMNMVTDVAGVQPRMKPGIIHRLDEEYFKKWKPSNLPSAMMTEKSGRLRKGGHGSYRCVPHIKDTAVHVYGAQKYKVANLPLVPEVQIPEEIFQVPPYRLIGLIIDPYKLNGIRRERMKALGFSGTANYTDIERIEDELAYAKEVMHQLHCTVLDVSNKAIEETASRIMSIIERNKELYGDKY